MERLGGLMNHKVNEKVGALIVGGMTRGQLAQELGISRATLRSRIDGRSGWMFSEVVKIARMTGCDLNDLID